MTDPVVETQLLLPRPRRETVARPRLAHALDRASDAPVTLVSAPAGFGKTTLISTWLHARLTERPAADAGRCAAWVSLTGRDRKPASFWTYTLSALDRAVPGSAAASLTLMRSGHAPIETVLAGVVNELSVHPGDVTLVLDDYHLADGPEVAEAMTFLVDHLPPPLRLIISTRADPALPLSRLRARGELVEIRSAELRFTAEEAAGYLNDLHGLGLDDDDITALEGRTEGWAAALQLAALSLHGRADASAFIAGFAGDDRYIVDYLADEVLAHQPEDIRRFLLETSILDRLTGPLCDAVSPAPEASGGLSGRAVLDLLERRNLFMVPLDDHRRWYRYHHLFADVLQTHLLRERPHEVPDLHRRASRWYAENGQPEDAVRHALAAGDVDRAADIVERAIPDLRRERRESVILHWIEEMPTDVVDHRPVLAIGFIGGLMAANDFTAVPPRLRALEELRRAPESELVVADRVELARLPAAIEMYWAGLALVGGDTAETIRRAECAIELAAEADDLTTSAASALLGLAYWTSGDVAAAHCAYTACAEGLTRAGHIADVLGCSLALADLELTLGRLRDAERTLNRALDLAQRRPTSQHADHTRPHHLDGHHILESGPAAMRGTADMLVALSRAAWHRNDLSSAAEYLRRADDLGEAAGLPQHPYRWRVAMARLAAAKKDWSTALDLLDEAQRVYVGDFSPRVHPIHATRARVLIAAGDLVGATAWAADHAVVDDDLTYLHEYEHLTLARIWLAQHENGQHQNSQHRNDQHEGRRSGNPGPLVRATRLLDRLLVAAEAGARVGTLIEVEILRARAQQAAGDRDAALAALAHAVRLAEPDGWVRFFVDAGSPTRELLGVLAAREPASAFLGDVLTATATVTAGAPARSDLDGRRVGGLHQRASVASRADEHRGALSGRAESVRHNPVPGSADASLDGRLVDPLSERELDVLRLLTSDLDGLGIAGELVVSLNTVRTHTKHIYAKLGVNNRRAAITKAHQLGLLARASSR